MIPKQVVYLVLVVVLVAAGLWINRVTDRAPAMPNGVTIESEPEQVPVNNAKPWIVGDYTFSPTATYVVRARVLGVETYRFDREADFSPADWVLGWKLMSDSAILKRMSVSQEARDYDYQGRPITENEIIANSANTHMVPANPEIARRMKSVRVDDIIRARGYLVHVNGPNGYVWMTSVSRTDVGRKGSEIFWVEHLGIEVH